MPVSQAVVNLRWDIKVICEPSWATFIKDRNFHWNWGRFHRLSHDSTEWDSEKSNSTDRTTFQALQGELGDLRQKSSVRRTSAGQEETLRITVGSQAKGKPSAEPVKQDALTTCSNKKRRAGSLGRDKVPDSEKKDDNHPTEYPWCPNYYFLVWSSRKWAKKLHPMQILYFTSSYLLPERLNGIREAERLQAEMIPARGMLKIFERSLMGSFFSLCDEWTQEIIRR